MTDPEDYIDALHKEVTELINKKGYFVHIPREHVKIVLQAILRLEESDVRKGNAPKR